MEFYPSVDDDEKYTKIIEPWFLNALYKLSNSNTSVRVRKIDVFENASKAHLGGFKGDKKQLENYIGKKGSQNYSDLIDKVVVSLVNKGFAIHAVANKADGTGWDASDYSIE
jgi:hypothetical protein